MLLTVHITWSPPEIAAQKNRAAVFAISNKLENFRVSPGPYRSGRPPMSRTMITGSLSTFMKSCDRPCSEYNLGNCKHLFNNGRFILLCKLFVSLFIDGWIARISFSYLQCYLHLLISVPILISLFHTLFSVKNEL